MKAMLAGGKPTAALPQGIATPTAAPVTDKVMSEQDKELEALRKQIDNL